MKKYILSVLVAVAFSLNGVASNDVEVFENLSNKDMQNEKNIQIIPEEKTCGQKYLEDFERLENLGLTFEAAGAIAFHNFQKCTGTL
ncbi:hypothetical protein GOQ30_06315 [Flavobacterium sp. TP390]|uniref:Uncharacterized protein n=1 Tax=Flavobacterium profundi TaxID=1774945 RepID=A0A6I4IGG2_9FLAO|nr:hypothetical protein [Flavobacterium profundi]MVO08775.1 hypothetical protein [Flavobacterium profundi]